MVAGMCMIGTRSVRAAIVGAAGGPKTIDGNVGPTKRPCFNRLSPYRIDAVCAGQAIVQGAFLRIEGGHDVSDHEDEGAEDL